MNAQKLFSKTDHFVEAWAKTMIRFRWFIPIIAILAGGFIGSGGRFIEFKNDYQYFFSKENPELNNFEANQKIYKKNDNCLFVLAPKSGEVFTRQTLAAIEWLTEESWQLPYSSRVDSISNYQHLEADGDDIVVDDLYYDAEQLSDEQIEKIRRVSTTEPLLLNKVINERGHVAGVNVTIELPGNHADEATEVVAKAREIIGWDENPEGESFFDNFPEFDVYISGMVPLSNAFAESAKGDFGTLFPLMFAAIFLMLAILLRSISATIAAIVVIILSIMTGMGLTGWLGIPLTPPSSTAPVMIATLAVADSVHILVSLLNEMRMGRPKREALIEALRINMGPVFLTSLTTAIGFLTMNFSDAPPFRDLGNIVAMGVMAAFVYSVTVLPAVVAILPFKVKPKPVQEKSKGMERFADWVILRKTPLLAGGILVMISLAACIPLNDLNDKFVEYFDETTIFRKHADFTMENLTGVYSIEYSVGSDSQSGINEPLYQAKLEAFAQYWRSKPKVLHVNSFTDIMKRVNKGMHGDDPAMYTIPTNRAMAAQFLLLYGNSLPRGLELDNMINVDESSTRFIVTLGDMSAKELRQYAKDGENWLLENTPESMHAIGVSPSIMFAHISERNIKSMLFGTTLALILISGILMIALRSIRMGFISLMPNLAPAVMAFGAWGILVGNIGLSLSVVTAMSLGIIVDDTVHFLSKYTRARREKGLNPEEAVRYAFATVGKALVVTSLVLVVGFLILSTSSFELNRGMGRLTAIVIIFALAADFFVLPALLMALGKTKLAVAPAEIEPEPA